MKKTEKNFDAVAFQRKRRRELSDLYNSDKAEFDRQLEAIRKKYGLHTTKKKSSKRKPLHQA
jgi:hypothetical protein